MRHGPRAVCTLYLFVKSLGYLHFACDIISMTRANPEGPCRKIKHQRRFRTCIPPILTLSSLSPTMDTLPIDTSHPAVRDYLALVRLQVLTPLSLLLNMATVVVCSSVVTPGIARVAKLHPTSITPSSAAIGAYVGAIFICQIGYCFMLVMARKPETKVRSLVNTRLFY